MLRDGERTWPRALRGACPTSAARPSAGGVRRHETTRTSHPSARARPTHAPQHDVGHSPDGTQPRARRPALAPPAYAAQSSPGNPSREHREQTLTTAMNCEFSGNLSWNETDVELLKGTFVIRRTSTLFERGVEPEGMMRSVYGGVPEPVMSTVRFWHWRGVETMLNEYAAASVAKGAAAARTGRMRGPGIEGRAPSARRTRQRCCVKLADGGRGRGLHPRTRPAP